MVSIDISRSVFHIAVPARLVIPSLRILLATGPLEIASTRDPADPLAWRQWHHWSLAPQLFKVRLNKGKNVLTAHILTRGNMNLAYFDFKRAHTALVSSTHCQTKQTRWSEGNLTRHLPHDAQGSLDKLALPLVTSWHHAVFSALKS
jgi:hypothetical protein